MYRKGPVCVVFGAARLSAAWSSPISLRKYEHVFRIDGMRRQAPLIDRSIDSFVQHVIFVLRSPSVFKKCFVTQSITHYGQRAPLNSVAHMHTAAAEPRSVLGFSLGTMTEFRPAALTGKALSSSSASAALQHTMLQTALCR